MLKLLTIIGARPQIIKAAALSRAIHNNYTGKIIEIIVHTGQHYDEKMSQIFFDELCIPKPDYNLAVGSGSHGKQTAAMISGIEDILIKEKTGLPVALAEDPLTCVVRGSGKVLLDIDLLRQVTIA